MSIAAVCLQTSWTRVRDWGQHEESRVRIAGSRTRLDRRGVWGSRACRRSARRHVVQAPPSTLADGLKELFPHVRIDVAAKLVEFDGTVPIDAHDAETPHDFLEVIVCTPDTKEHESLVMTRATAAHVHAALLLVGLEPGAPGTWEWDGTNVRPIPPRGDAVEVVFVTRDAAGAEVVSRPVDWVVSVHGTKRLADLPDTGFLFAGSTFRRLGDSEAYSADADGTLVGLCTFGSETIALARVIHHESSVEEPEWIADSARVPPYGAPVTVRVRPARPPEN